MPLSVDGRSENEDPAVIGNEPFAITFTRIDGPTPPRTAVITARGVPANFGAGSARFFMG